MERERVLAALRAHEIELKQAGIVGLLVFGSTARGDAAAKDVDLLAALDKDRKLSLLDVIHIENQISDFLGEPVDLLVEGTLKAHVVENVRSEAVRAF
jgi:uncharacterized protein